MVLPNDRRLRLLIAHSEAEKIASLMRLFSHPTISLHVAENGIEAVSRAREFQPDAVLLDTALRGMDGFDVFRTLKKDAALRGARVVLVGAAEQGALALAKDFGAYACFRAPYNESRLHDKVREALSAAPGTESGPLRRPS